MKKGGRYVLLAAERSALVTVGEGAAGGAGASRRSSRMDGKATRATDSSSTRRHVAGCADLPPDALVTPVRTFCNDLPIQYEEEIVHLDY